MLDYSAWTRLVPSLGPDQPSALPLTAIIERLRKLTAAAGDEETFEASYVIMFRGLSTVGAHPNDQVLNYYLDDQNGRGVFAHVQPIARSPSSLEEPNLLSALLLVAHLSQMVLERRGCEHGAADRVNDRFVATFKSIGQSAVDSGSPQ